MIKGPNIYRRRAHESFKRPQPAPSAATPKSESKSQLVKELIASDKKGEDTGAASINSADSTSGLLKLPRIPSSKSALNQLVASNPTTKPDKREPPKQRSVAGSPRPDERRKSVGRVQSAGRKGGEVEGKGRKTSAGDEIGLQSPLSRATSQVSIVSQKRSGGAGQAPLSRAASQASVLSVKSLAGYDEVVQNDGRESNMSNSGALRKVEGIVKTADLNGRISVDLLISKNIVSAEGLQHFEALDYLTHLSHIRLDRCEIRHLDGLATLTSITHLYLQHNLISVIENLSDLINLRFLTLADNKICQVSGLKSLKSLKFLDLARNLIVDVNPIELPTSLQYVIFSENPACLSPDYRLKLVSGLPCMYELDEVKVTKTERSLARTVFGSWRGMDPETLLEESSDDDSGSEEVVTESIEIVKQASEITLFEPEKPSPFSKAVQDMITRSKERQKQTAVDFSSRLIDIKAKLKESSRSRVEQIRKRIQELELSEEMD
ncbi:hypothetical protein HDU67_008109 [Dinochytrium kinnereticum]|nr:hypothetical protein HDU67_008109 [Dinochytrium kinnereticum]